MKNSKISILGCGWLGFALAERLLELGYSVKGSTTSQGKLSTLKSLGIDPFLITLTETKVEGNISKFLDESETLIINIPPGIRKNPKKNHFSEIENLLPYIKKIAVKNVLFVSSTSVFKDEVSIPIITSDVSPNAASNSAKQVIKIENLFQNNSAFKSTILRFSGLFNDERHPGKLLSGRDNISNPNAPVNLIHKQDCINIISHILDKNLWNVSLNASFPDHPKKQEYYYNYCKTRNLPLPKFDKNSPSKGKIIDGSSLAQLLEYGYKLSL